ncbi:MAG: SusC/RagA family TonB-linked outer membrane protein [Bacteroidota bacterium]
MRKLMAILTAMFMVGFAFAQQKTVTGKVSGDDGSPLPGVSVTVKGTKAGTTTTADGSFSLDVPSNAKTLVFSFINYTTQEVSISNYVPGRTALSVSMNSEEKTLSEVVVVGYGTQKKKTVTSAIGKIDAAPIADLITPSVDRQLAGRTAGIQVTSPTGLVNVAPRIRIRGVNSINGSRSPLIVLDGVPVIDGGFSGVANTNALADINPADIESVEVLKDGSATAIYGSRASNGVVLITTKKGKSGRSNVNYSVVVGYSNPYNRFDMLNAGEFNTIANEKFTNAGQAAQAFFNADSTNTDWQDLIYNKNAMSQTHNLSVDGGNDRTNYFFSVNYTDQQGMIVTNKVKRYALRSNVQHKVNKWFTISNNLTISRTEDNDQNNGGNALSGAVAAALRALPNVRAFDPANTTFDGYNVLANGAALGQDANLRPIENNYSNIAFVLNKNRYNSIKHRILNNLSFDIKPVQWLTVTSKVGIDYATGVDFQSLDSRHGDGRGSQGFVYNQNLNNLRWVWQNYANANKTFDKHTISATIGTEAQNETFSSFNGQGPVISDAFFAQQNLISGSYATQFSGGSYSEGPGFVSYFGRLNYDYDNKYFLQASLRRDGLSRFSAANRFGTFPGVSAGWRISEESFWKGNKALSFFDEVKLRGSWAKVGNDQIAGGLFPYLSQYGSAPYGATSGIAVSVVGNDGLTWETNEKLNVGIDLTFWKNRLNFTFDWFQNNNNGLVLAAPLPVSFGVPGNSIFRNIGDMQNKGFEVSLGGTIVRNRNFSWDININYTTVQNEVKALYLNQDVIGAYNILRLGQPINALFGYEFAGVNSGNGNPMYVKADGTLIQGNIPTLSYFTVVKSDDPTLGTAATLAGTDRRILGNVLPTWFGGINNTLRYKGFTLDMLWRYSGGNKIFNLTEQEALVNQAFQNNGKIILNRWQKAGDVTDIPRLWYGRDNFTNLQQNASSRFVESGDFARLENLQLSYAFQLKNTKISNAGVKSFRVFIQAQNLLLITNYSGIDPENITEGGIDNNTVPRPRVYSFGFNLGL